MLWVGAAGADSILGVDWGGLYGNSFSSTLNQGLGGAVTSTGDYTFDGVSDAAYRIPFGSVFTPSSDSRYLAPDGKSGLLYTGLQLVNHSTASVPSDAGIYRWSAVVNPNQLQKTNPTLGGLNPMSMSAAYFVKKVDFLNGLDSSEELGFADVVDGVSMDVYVRNTNVAVIGFLVQESANWYATIHKPSANNAYAVLSVNPCTAEWYAFDPVSNQFLNAGNPGEAVPGSVFTNIMAFGIYGQHMSYNGVAVNAEKFDVQGFFGTFEPVPDAPLVPRSGTSFGFFTGLSSEEIQQVRQAAVLRAEEFFTSQSGEPLDPRDIIVDWNDRGDFTRYWNQDIMMFAMRAFELNEMLDEANAAVQEMCQYHLDRPQTLLEIHSFPTVTDALFSMCRFYGPNGSRAAGRVSNATYAKVLETMWEWTRVKSDLSLTETQESETWRITDSENHHAQYWSTCWGFSLLLKDEPLYQDLTYDDGYTPQEHYDAWTAYLREYLLQRITKGMLVEIDSPSYASATLKCVYLLADFSDDPVLKYRAGQFLSLYWAMWAEQQIDSVCGGAKARCYPDAAQGGADFINRAAWYAFGVGDPEFRHISMLQFIMSSWQVPETVLDLILASSGRGIYEVRQRRMGLALSGYNSSEDYRLRPDFGGILRYSWCTPDFIMSSLMTEARPATDWSSISSQNRWSGVIFRGHTNARVYPHVTPSDTSSYNGFWSAQSKGSLISQKLRTSVGANQWNVWFSKDGVSAPEQDGDWLFCEATNAYVAVRVVDGGFSSLNETNAGRWVTCSNQYSPVIIEVSQKSDFSDMAAFQDAVFALSVSGDADSTLWYTGLSGDQFVFYTDQSSPPEINGNVVNYAPLDVYDSPYIQGEFGSGTVVVQYGGNKIIIDAAPFTNSDDAVALWHFDEVLQDAGGSYYGDDASEPARSAIDAREYADSTNTISIISDGKFGHAIRCESVEGDQYMMTGSAGWPVDKGTFRYQGWIRLQSGDPGGFLFHVYDQVYLSVTASNATFRINKSGVITNVASDNIVECSAAISTSNEWQYIEAVYDGEEIKLLTEKETVSGPGIGAFIPDKRNIYIGSRKNKSNFVGDMDEVRISVASSVSVPDPLDFDEDNLPDEWEVERFGSRAVSDGTGDADGDGFLDVYEYRAGTSPVDSESLLQLNGVFPGIASGQWDVSWTSVDGKSYRVLSTPDLLSGIWITNEAGVVGTAPENSLTITSEGSAGFVKIETE